jgi:acetyl esterase
MSERPMPSEEGILAFHKRCEDFYPADAVDADIVQQRAWYDALCAAFDAPVPAGMVKQDGMVAGCSTSMAAASSWARSTAMMRSARG